VEPDGARVWLTDIDRAAGTDGVGVGVVLWTGVGVLDVVGAVLAAADALALGVVLAVGLVDGCALGLADGAVEGDPVAPGAGLGPPPEPDGPVDDGPPPLTDPPPECCWVAILVWCVMTFFGTPSGPATVCAKFWTGLGAAGQRNHRDHDAPTGADPRGEPAVRLRAIRGPEAGQGGGLAGQLCLGARGGQSLEDRVVLEPAEVLVVRTHLSSPPRGRSDRGRAPSDHDAR
jgi:hypothetical protein